jgi:ATP-dependent helicase HrpB
MSATIDADAVAALIGTDAQPAPVIDCEGRTFPVEVTWRPMNKKDRLEHAVSAAVTAALANPGDVLVFLPGIGEIRRTPISMLSMGRSARRSRTLRCKFRPGGAGWLSQPTSPRPL